MDSYFDLFELPVAYHLDPVLLKQRYLTRARALHPDRFARATPTEQQEALRQSSLTNEAYRVLVEPRLRLDYLFQLYEVSTENEGTQHLPPDFLFEMMELNEAVEALTKGNVRQQQSLGEQIAQRAAALDARLQDDLTRFDAVEDGTARRNLLVDLLGTYLQRKYLLRLEGALATFAAS